MERFLIDEREEKESEITRYFRVIIKLEISIRQRSIGVSLEVRMEAG